MLYTKIRQLYVQVERKLARCCLVKYFQLEIVKVMIFSYNFLSHLLSLCMPTIVWLQGSAWRADPWFLPLPSLWSDK